MTLVSKLSNLFSDVLMFTYELQFSLNDACVVLYLWCYLLLLLTMTQTFHLFSMGRPFQAEKRAMMVLVSVFWDTLVHASTMSCISSTETAGTTSLSLFSLSPSYSSQCCRVFGPPHNRLPPKSLFTFFSHVPPRKHSNAGLLMFMLSTCQNRGELSGSGSVNWALIRCCSN